MAEFPGLGKHCGFEACRQLDFLPMKCDACEKVFCKDHVTYISHQCPSSYRKVPVCPLCNQPVPGKRGEQPDIAVGEHIDRDCQSDPAKAKRNKIYTNRCSFKGCRQKELVPIVCNSCRLNFCLKHRHATDHDCKGFQGTGRSINNAGAAAVHRAQQQQQKSKKPTSCSSASANAASSRANKLIPEHMTEDEAVAMAMQMSLNDQTTAAASGGNPQEDEDLALARALQQSEYNQQPEQRRRQRNCVMS